MNNSSNTPEIKPIRPLKCPLTPYQLFTPVDTVFLKNLTLEQQLLGLYKLYNEFIKQFNQIIPEINKIPVLQEALQQLQVWVGNQLISLASQITEGDKDTLTAANAYTDNKFANLPCQTYPSGIAYGGLTAAEYDALNLTAEQYDAYQWTAWFYDFYAKYYLYGEDGTVYLEFKDHVILNPNESIFEMNDPPINTGDRYLVEISLGNFGNAGEIKNVTIAGTNNTGANLNLSVPSGGSATQAVIWNEKPSTVSFQNPLSETIMLQNIFIKIKPLGAK